MLTDDQKELADGFFKLGFSDVAITKKLGLPKKSIYVYQYRKSLGIEAKTVLQSRHQVFLDLANAGVSDKQIARIYGAKERSIYVTLCSYGFRRKDQKRVIEEIAKVSGSTSIKPSPSKAAPKKVTPKKAVAPKVKPKPKAKPKA